MHFPSRPAGDTTGPGLVPSGLSRRLRVVLLLVVFVGSLVSLALAARSLGHILHHEDALARADAIAVLGGARLTRVAEAGDLQLAGWAPRVVLSPQAREPVEIMLRARGLEIPSEVDIQRRALVQMGVPESAIEVLGSGETATAGEASALRALALSRGWRRLIIVTSKLHTARAALTFTRAFAGTEIDVRVRASRYDPADVDRWWVERADLRFALFESQKLAAYWLGIAD